MIIAIFFLTWVNLEVAGQISSMVRICAARGNESAMMIASTAAHSGIGYESRNKSIQLVSYATPSIFDYASYSLAINSIYALRNGYGMRLIDAGVGGHEPHDSRWNKVKILEDLCCSWNQLSSTFAVSGISSTETICSPAKRMFCM